MDYLATVPFEALDRFYFEDVVGQMPGPLRRLAVDLRVLRGSRSEQPIKTLRYLYLHNYLFLPWIWDDMFETSAAVRLSIGQAYILLVIYAVIMDQRVDQQAPDIPGIPLVQQQLLLKSSEILSRRFQAPGSFWDRHYACLTEAAEALGIESDCRDAHTRPYTYEVMEKVCVGKAAVLRMLAYALALVSERWQVLPVLESAINKLLLADQLYDDALDWRPDFEAGRHTLPIVLALEAAGEPHQAATALSTDDLEGYLDRYGILVFMAQQAVAALTEARAELQAAGLVETKWDIFLSERLMLMRRQSRFYNAIRILGGLVQALDRSSR